MSNYEQRVRNPNRADHIKQGKALVHAIEGLDQVKPRGMIERALAGLLLTAYKRRLRAIVLALVPSAQL